MPYILFQQVESVGKDGRASQLLSVPISVLKEQLEDEVNGESDLKISTHYQTTNFRLFQTERVCTRQFQI